MSMSRRLQNELYKMRELLWFLLEGEKCCFCRKLLLTKPSRKIRFGNGKAEPLELDITIHHKDENHSNNKFDNLALAHETCHKRHHAVLVFAKFRKTLAA